MQYACTYTLQPYCDITSRLFCRMINVEIVLLFSALEPKAEVHYCDHPLYVVLPSSVVRPSLSFSFSTSSLKPLNGIQRNFTGSKISTSSTKFVFSGRSEKQDGRPVLWLAETCSTSGYPLNPLNGIQRNLTESKILTSSTKFVLFGPIEKTRWRPWPLIGGDIITVTLDYIEAQQTISSHWLINIYISQYLK